jgi:methionyl-tRNA synthetase
MNERYYITTPIFYVNGTPHVGHAYSAIAADVLARWHRLDGDDVFFLTGTDEYGQKVEQTARDLGIEPQALADRNAAEFQDVARRLNISNDDFIRTTQPRHHRTCAALW